MNCTNCNEKIEYKGKFCLNCGEPLTSKEPVTAEVSQTENNFELKPKILVETPNVQTSNTESTSKPYLTNSIFDSKYFDDPNSRNINDMGYQNYLNIIKKINSSMNFNDLWVGFIGIIATRTMAYNGFGFDIGLFFQTIINILVVSWPFMLLAYFATNKAVTTANISTSFPLFFVGENEKTRSNILHEAMETVNGPENQTIHIICWILGIVVFFSKPEFAFLSRICFALSSTLMLSTIIQSVKAFKWWSILTFMPMIAIIATFS